jgi:hypothetical protein
LSGSRAGTGTGLAAGEQIDLRKWRWGEGRHGDGVLGICGVDGGLRRGSAEDIEMRGGWSKGGDVKLRGWAYTVVDVKKEHGALIDSSVCVAVCVAVCGFVSLRSSFRHLRGSCSCCR